MRQSDHGAVAYQLIVAVIENRRAESRHGCALISISSAVQPSRFEQDVIRYADLAYIVQRRSSKWHLLAAGGKPILVASKRA